MIIRVIRVTEASSGISILVKPHPVQAEYNPENALVMRVGEEVNCCSDMQFGSSTDV
jgi:hypothetical protein